MTQRNNQFLKPLNARNPANVSTDGKIFDYSHATQLFVADNYRLQPKYSFLYYVRFDRDERVSTIKNSAHLTETGQLVKSVSLPKFSIDSKTLNAYNRKNIVQTKINYDPVQITFHDDGDNTVLDFWKDYYDYYYRDGDYRNRFSDVTTSNYQQTHKYHFNNSAPMNSWGYSLRDKSNEVHLLKNIRIYSLNRGTFTEYVLVNPKITSFQHGQHTAGENSPMTHTMSVSYESVLYYYGYVTDSSISGMLNLHYDRRPSSLTPTGIRSTGTGGFKRPRVFGARGVFGNGGILDTTDQIVGDLKSGNISGAIAKGFKGYQNNKGANLKDIAKMEAKRALIKGILTGTNPFSGVNIPVISNLAKGVGGAVQDGANWTAAKFGINQTNVNNQSSGYTASPQSSTSKVSYDQKQRLNTNGTPGETNVVSNGSNVSTNKPGDNYFNSPTYRMPKDTSADISRDTGSNPVQLNGSVQGPNNAASLRRAQNEAAGVDTLPAAGSRPGGIAFNQDARPAPAADAGSNWEPQTGGTGSSSYVPYYARTMNNTPTETSNQGRVSPANKASPIPGIQGGNGGVNI
jgi:hypothetical protein